MVKKQAEAEVLKSNPFITKSTSKTLLTPCRRVGLSRKRKTPNSSNNSFSESVGDTSVSCVKTPDNSKHLEKPEAQNDVEQAQGKREKPQSQIPEETVKTKDVKKDEVQSKVKSLGRSRVSKRLISSDEETPLEPQNKSKRKREIAIPENESLDCPDVKTGIKSRRISPRKKRQTAGHKYDTNLSDTSDEEIEDFHNDSVKNLKTSQRKNKGNVKVKTERSSKIVTLKTDVASAVKIEEKTESEDTPTGKGTTPLAPLKDVTNQEKNASEDQQIIKNADENNVKRKSPISGCEKSNSNSPSEDNQDDMNDFDFNATKCIKTYQRKHKIIQEKRESTVLKSEEKSTPPIDLPVPKPEKKSKKIRRSLSTKKSSYEEKESKVAIKQCSVTLSPLQMNEDDIQVISELASTEIQELEKQIKEKHLLIDELKQAEIIKKKHDLKELQELTARWKNGCVSALNDLLALLQENGNIDMPTLLKNFSIPEEMIAVTDSGDLV